jgi:hypothetical protein
MSSGAGWEVHIWEADEILVSRQRERTGSAVRRGGRAEGSAPHGFHCSRERRCLMGESLRKRCGPQFEEGHPLRCLSSPKCEHHWFYDFRVNRRRYRATTETANKQEAKKFAAKERRRILEVDRAFASSRTSRFERSAARTCRTTLNSKRSVERERERSRKKGAGAE